VQELAQELFPGAELSTEKDLTGMDRVFVINQGMAEG